MSLALSTGGRRYGWKRDKRDHRDFQFAETFATKIGPKTDFAPSLDLSPQCPAVYDQGDEGSCTANAAAALVEFMQMKLKTPVTPFVPARNFIYYNTRLLEGTTRSDSGGEVRDALTALSDFGVPPEVMYPYSPQTLLMKPPRQLYVLARQDLIPATCYARVGQDIASLKTALAGGFLVDFGFDCFAQLESDQAAADGLIYLPGPTDQSIGGHSVVLVGWDDHISCNGSMGAFKFRNSWGAAWGLAGYGYLPYAYITNTQLCSDFWVFDAL